MSGFSSIFNFFLLNHDITNPRFFFAQKFDFKMTNYDMINKYIVHKINQYTAANIKDFSL